MITLYLQSDLKYRAVQEHQIMGKIIQGIFFQEGQRFLRELPVADGYRPRLRHIGHKAAQRPHPMHFAGSTLSLLEYRFILPIKYSRCPNSPAKWGSKLKC